MPRYLVDYSINKSFIVEAKDEDEAAEKVVGKVGECEIWQTQLAEDVFPNNDSGYPEIK